MRPSFVTSVGAVTSTTTPFVASGAFGAAVKGRRFVTAAATWVGVDTPGSSAMVSDAGVPAAGAV